MLSGTDFANTKFLFPILAGTPSIAKASSDSLVVSRSDLYQGVLKESLPLGYAGKRCGKSFPFGNHFNVYPKHSTAFQILVTTVQ